MSRLLPLAALVRFAFTAHATTGDREQRSRQVAKAT